MGKERQLKFWESDMPNVLPSTIRATASLLSALAALFAYKPTAVWAQANDISPLLNLRIQELRAHSTRHHPEHSEVLPNQLPTLGKGSTYPSLLLNRYLSIFVSDVDTMRAIKFSEVMDKLVGEITSDEPGDKQLTKQILFQQWWDSANQGAGLGLGPHCDDVTAPTGDTVHFTATSLQNNFPYRCPRVEGVMEASNDPFSIEEPTNPTSSGDPPNGNAYSAIAFSNRFDLLSARVNAPNAPGKVIYPDCGEYRIVFARNSGVKDRSTDRNLIIFEARVPNPDPRPENEADAAPVGCLPILQFWHSLSDPRMTAEKRGKALHDFYLEGKLLHSKLPEPVVTIAHYGFNAGQIRTNQFLNSGAAPNTPPFDWTLREFKTLKTNGTLVIVPDSDKTNPGPSLFAVGTKDPRLAALNQDIRAQMVNILGLTPGAGGLGDVNSIGFSITGEGVNTFDSDESGKGPPTNPPSASTDPDNGDIMATFDVGKVIPPPPRNDALVNNINAAVHIAAPAATISAANVVDRIRTQTCAGCHQFSDTNSSPTVVNDPFGLGGGAVWPSKSVGDVTHPPMTFTQESEQSGSLQDAISNSDDGKKHKRYAISTTVECLLDFREKLMKKALGLTHQPTGDHCPH
jgi:hypothetical protein